MNLLTLDSISKQYSERLLFDKVSLPINGGDRIGLIGVNGSGKSTLLRIAAGLETPDTGTRTLWGGVRVQYVGQEPQFDEHLTVLEHVLTGDTPQLQLWRRYEETAAALQVDPNSTQLQKRLGDLNAAMEEEGGWAAEANAKSILTQLGLPDFSTPIHTLSGGQRKRLALAYALIDRPDIHNSLLILDEPTNHIDASAIAWLEEYLLNTPGALLLVTHDRYFLDRVTNRIIELERRQLVTYVGNYTRYLEGRAERQEQLAVGEEKRQNTLRRELEWLRRGAMARGSKQKARKQRVEELMQIRYDRGEEKVAIALAARRLGDTVLDAQGLSKRYGDVAVLDGVNLHLEAGDRIGILGPNGAGKSTLLDMLAGKLQPDAGRIVWGDTVQLGYYDQRSAELHDRLRIIEFIEKEASVITTKEGERVEAAQMLEWFLFPRAMQYGRIGSLSGGERRRLYLLRTLIHQPNVLFLDEPTNDLDIQTLNVLEEFLDHFTGCLIVVSHDRYFLDCSVDFLVSLEAGKLSGRYPAPYSTYERLRAEAEAAKGAKIPSNKLSPTTLQPATLQPATFPSAPRKLSWKEQRELEQLEQLLPTLEAEKARLADTINNTTNYMQIQTLSERLEQISTELNNHEERWLELAAS